MITRPFARSSALLALAGISAAAAVAASNPSADVTTFATYVRNYNLVTMGDATFTSASDFQEGIAVEGTLTVNGNTMMSGGGVGYLPDGDPSCYVAGALVLNGGSTKLNSGYASTPNVGAGFTFANKQLHMPQGGGTLDSTNSSDARAASNPITNPIPSGWNWSTFASQMSAISADLAAAPVTGTISVSSQNLVLTPNVSSGVVVFQFDMNKFNGVNYNGQKLSNISINVPSNMTYVINVLNAPGKTVFPASVNFNAGSNNGQLLWNFIGSGQITLGGGQFFGAILAPNAYVFTTNTIPVGQVVCSSFRNNSAELHYMVFNPQLGLSTPVITSATGATGTAGQPFTYTITATNSPISFNATGLPAGLTINTTTGVISGTPVSGGTSTVTLSATNLTTNGYATGTATLTLTVNCLLTGVASPAGAGTVSGGGTYSYGSNASISATATSGYVFSNWSGPGVASPNFATTTVAMTGNQTVTANFTPVPPAITSPLTASVVSGNPFSYTITATNNPTSYNATGLPTGLTVNTSTGVISGSVATGGTYNITISATNSGGTGSATLVLTVNYSLTIAGSPAGAGSWTGAGIYAAGANAAINETAYSGYRTAGWSGAGVASPGSALTSVAMTSNQTVTALFVAQGNLTVAAGTGGTVTGSGWYDLNTNAAITATPAVDYVFSGWTGTGIASASSASTTVLVDATKTVTANFTMLPPVITSALTASDICGQAFSYTITATHHPSSYAATGLPAGLTLNTTTGVISGSPTVGGTFNVQISATNAGGTGSATLVLTVRYVLTISSSPLAGGSSTGAGYYMPGTVVNITETAAANYRLNGWSGPDAGAVASPSSASTTITMNANRTIYASFVKQAQLIVSTGVGGTATGGGTYDAGSTVPITATPSSDYTFAGWSGTGIADPTAPSTTVVVPDNKTVAANFSLLPPVITSPLTLADKLNETTTPYTITATHHPTSFGGAGLPNGLSVDASSGNIIGTPTQTGTFNVTISATNGGGTGTAALVLTVSQTYTLSISASPAMGGSFTGAGVYDPGTVVNIAETAAAGYRTAGWAGSGVGAVAAPASAATTVTMNGDCTLVAEFQAQGAVTVTATAGGTATGGGTFDIGSSAPIAATANQGYVFTGWTGSPDVASPESASTSVTVNSNEALVANFIAAANPEQLGSLVFPNAVPPGLNGVSATTSSMTAVITNKGSQPETVSSITTTGDFSVSVPLPIVLAPGASQNVPVTFAPTVLGQRNGVLTGVSNDPNNPVFQFTLVGTGVDPRQPPSATITAPATGYTGSPLKVSSTAFAPNNNLTLHSIEWMSPDGTWTVDALNVSGGNSSRQLGINFPTAGLYTLRAGASVDNGSTWVYSPSQQISISNGISSYTLQTMAVPSGANSIWYSPSPVVSKTYQVKHVNP